MYVYTVQYVKTRAAAGALDMVFHQLLQCCVVLCGEGVLACLQVEPGPRGHDALEGGVLEQPPAGNPAPFRQTGKELLDGGGGLWTEGLGWGWGST